MLTIRRATHADMNHIADYNTAMALETEQIELDRSRLISGVRAVLDDDTKGFYLLAEMDGEICGQLMITTEWSDWRNADFWWIQSVYVDPDYRRQGVYRQLQKAVIQSAQDDPSVCGIRLYVDEHNKRAQTVYEALGLDPSNYLMYELDWGLSNTSD